MDNFDAGRELWARVFGDDEAVIASFFDHFGRRLICISASREGRLVSALYLIPFDFVGGGRRQRALYLYAAATDPDCRGQGLMSGLIGKAKEFMNNNGFDLIYLMPSEKSLYDYYKRFSFEHCFFKKRAIIPVRGLSIKAPPGLFTVSEPADSEIIPSLCFDTGLPSPMMDSESLSYLRDLGMRFLRVKVRSGQDALLAYCTDDDGRERYFYRSRVMSCDLLPVLLDGARKSGFFPDGSSAEVSVPLGYSTCGFYYYYDNSGLVCFRDGVSDAVKRQKFEFGFDFA